MSFDRDERLLISCNRCPGCAVASGLQPGPAMTAHGPPWRDVLRHVRAQRPLCTPDRTASGRDDGRINQPHGQVIDKILRHGGPWPAPGPTLDVAAVVGEPSQLLRRQPAGETHLGGPLRLPCTDYAGGIPRRLPIVTDSRPPRRRYRPPRDRALICGPANRQSRPGTSKQRPRREEANCGPWPTLRARHP